MTAVLCTIPSMALLDLLKPLHVVRPRPRQAPLGERRGTPPRRPCGQSTPSVSRRRPKGDAPSGTASQGRPLRSVRPPHLGRPTSVPFALMSVACDSQNVSTYTVLRVLEDDQGRTRTKTLWRVRQPVPRARDSPVVAAGRVGSAQVLRGVPLGRGSLDGHGAGSVPPSPSARDRRLSAATGIHEWYRGLSREPRGAPIPAHKPWAVQDSNLRPPACKAGALTS